MLIASFADPGAAAALAARLGVVPPFPGCVVWRPAGWAAGPEPLAGVQGDIVDRARSAVLTTGEIAAALARDGAGAMTAWAPPFRLAWRTGDGITAAADYAGLAHWFVWQGEGVAAIASTATAIARTFGLAPDAAALGGLALTGAMIGRDSAIAGVAKLGAGQVATLAEGRLTFADAPPPRQLAAPEDAMVAAVARLIAAHPGAELELSGGWDSRVILAAIPAGLRRGRTGVTIGGADNADVPPAIALARATGLAHEIIDPAVMDGIDAEAFTALLATAAARDDYAANPLDRASINFINAGRTQVARFNGQNGEILRGFYYPGQPLGAKPSVALARRVIDWRIFANDVVDPALFDAKWYAAMRADAAARIEAQLLSGDDADWGTALDRYYFDQRMHRWYGTSASAAIGDRPLLLPFFDPDVLALARSLPPAAKSGSRYAAQLVTRLDPALAAIRLESGLVPAAVAAGGLGNRIVLARRFAGKALAKARQKLFTHDRATFGSASSLALAAALGLPRAVDTHRLAALGIFDPARLDAFAAGTWLPSRATTGFILNCHFLLERLAAGDAA